MFADFSVGDKWLKKVNLAREHLPHFFYKKLYRWSYDFIMTNNPLAFVCGANQIAKTSTMIRKVIYRATSKHLWKYMYRTRPKNAWYFYPGTKVLDIEWDGKWMEWMPQVPSSHPLHKIYGWEKIKNRQQFTGIRFRTGVELNFRYYSQGVSSLQSSTLSDIYGDEEIPFRFCEEMRGRLMASKGTWNSGFTATLGQQYWYDVMEKQGMPGERHPEAFKRIISLFDCMKYIDGSQGEIWPTYKSIADFIKTLDNDEDTIKRRVFGRFIPTTGLAFESYSYEKTTISRIVLSRQMDYFLVVDPGSGGKLGHPTGILLLGVDNEKHRIYVLSPWRGDGIVTSNGFIIRQMMEMAGSCPLQALIYDGAAADFKLDVIEALPRLPLIAADKKRDFGFGRVNSYLDVGAIKIPESRPLGVASWDRDENMKLHEELKLTRRTENLQGQKTGNQIDDLTDCLRYACMHIHLPLDVLYQEARKERLRERLNIHDEPRSKFDGRAYLMQKGNYDSGTDFWVHNYNAMNNTFYE